MEDFEVDWLGDVKGFSLGVVPGVPSDLSPARFARPTSYKVVIR